MECSCIGSMQVFRIDYSMEATVGPSAAHASICSFPYLGKVGRQGEWH